MTASQKRKAFHPSLLSLKYTDVITTKAVQGDLWVVLPSCGSPAEVTFSHLFM